MSHPLRSFALGSLTALCGVAAAQEGAPSTEEGNATPAQESGAPAPQLSDAQVLEALRDSLPFDLHGGVLLWSYKPFVDGYDSKTEIYYVNLILDASYEDYGFHFEPRFRDTKLRPFFESNIWIQEMYLSWHPCDDDTGTLKAGKVYSQFGRFWDGTFYGNVPYFDGLKLDPDLGLSWEDRLELGDRVALDYSVQWFLQDGETNGSLQGRDTVSIGTQRDVLVARAAPTFELGEDEDKSVTVGVSGMAFEADLTTPADDEDVTRANAEASLDLGGFTAFADYTHQHGNHVIDFPLPGSTSSDIDYLMSGLSYETGDWTFRYSYSTADYNDEDVDELLHLPGIVYQVNEHISIWLEYVYWSQDASGDDTILDRSLNVILYGFF